MLSIITLGFIGFINLFFIPFISLRIYCKRHSIEWGFTPDMVFIYILMTILNLPFTRVLANVMENILISEVHAESSKYTVVALIVAVFLPYVIEIVEKVVHIQVSIELRENEYKSTKDIQVEGTDEKKD